MRYLADTQTTLVPSTTRQNRNKDYDNPRSYF